MEDMHTVFSYWQQSFSCYGVACICQMEGQEANPAFIETINQSPILCRQHSRVSNESANLPWLTSTCWGINVHSLVLLPFWDKETGNQNLSYPATNPLELWTEEKNYKPMVVNSSQHSKTRSKEEITVIQPRNLSDMRFHHTGEKRTFRRKHYYFQLLLDFKKPPQFLEKMGFHLSLVKSKAAV